MKNNIMITGYGKVFGTLLDKNKVTKSEKKEISAEYRKIMDRAKDIGADNVLLSSYTLCAFFIALCRVKKNNTPEENCGMIADGLKNTPYVKMFLGSGDGYFSDKRMEKRYKWAEESKKRKYENDWVVDVGGKTEDYDMSYDYTECGCVKLCRDEGCPELCRYLCSLDFLLVEIMGIKLKRTKTLAAGDEKCDFRFSR